MLLVTALIVVIVHTLLVKFDFVNLLEKASYLEIDHKIGFLVMCLVFLILNWGIEALKWQLAMQQYTTMDFATSLRSVLAGITVGLLTPAKLGEYGGRMILVDETKRAASGLATFLTSIAQMTVTIVFGVISVVVLAYKLQFLEIDLRYIYFGSGFFLLVIVGSFVMLPEILNYFFKAPFLQKHIGRIKDTEVSRHLFIRLLFLSSLRFLTYSLQYLFVFFYLGVQHNTVEFLAYISVVFLLQTLLPLPPLASIAGRGGIALVVFSALDINEVLVLLAAVTIWVINLLLPALCGLVIVLKHKTQIVVGKL